MPLAVLTDGLPLRLPYRRILAELVEPFVDPVLHRLSRDYVGDSAGRCLLWPDCRGGSKPQASPSCRGIDGIDRQGRARLDPRLARRPRPKGALPFSS